MSLKVILVAGLFVAGYCVIIKLMNYCLVWDVLILGSRLLTCHSPFTCKAKFTIGIFQPESQPYPKVSCLMSEIWHLISKILVLDSWFLVLSSKKNLYLWGSNMKKIN